MLAIVGALLLSACGGQSAPAKHAVTQHGESEPEHVGLRLASLGSPLIHTTGQPHIVREIQLAGEAAARTLPSVPLAAMANLLLHLDDDSHHPLPPVELRPGKSGQAAANPWVAAPLPAAPAVVGGGAGVTAPRIRAVDVSIVGTIAAFDGEKLSVRTDRGDLAVILARDTRVSEGALGSRSDLVPGGFVSVMKRPDSTARSLQLYPTGLPTPPPGLTPMVGPDQGSVLLHGMISGVYPGSVTVSAAGQIFPVTLTDGTRILKAAETTLARVKPGREVAIRATQPAPSEPATASAILLTDTRAPRGDGA